ncbi:MAG: hypothetical protein MJE68_21255, partial [Proteobacteria bacterium]|nr:hypothetical protein [Pseudomonadota bacterium]
MGEEISNTSECKLELIKVNNGQCDAPKNFNLLEQLVAIVSLRQLKGFHSNYQCFYDIVPIVGLPCNDVSPVVVSFNLSSDELIKDSLDEIFYNFKPTKVRPPAVTLSLSRALFKFMESLNWQKLGIITETGSTYFSHMAETVYIEAKDDSSINVVTYQQLQVQANERINFVRNASKITLLSTSLETTVDILCSAYEGNAVWPKYVWILHSYLLEDIKSIDATCSISRALENVIFIRQQIDEDSSYTNPYSIALHNAVWMSVRQLLNLSIGEEKRLISHDVIEVTQVRSATEIPLVDINGSDLNFLDDRIKEVAISDEFEMRFEGASTGYTVIFSIEIIIGFLFVTIMLIGYVYFRNEPEVKSTSFMLSLLIFLGCYLNLLFLLFLLYFHQPIPIPEATLNAICGLFPWISGLGISIALVIATVLVKLARVYHIFNRVTAKPMGKQSSDFVLAGYVLLILLPMIVILMTWIITDRFKITYQPS